MIVRLSPALQERGVAALRLMRLDRPRDLALLLFLGLLANWVATGGHLAAGVLPFLLVVVALRCAAWVFLDLGTERFLPRAAPLLDELHAVDTHDALRIAVSLCGFGFLALLLIDPLTLFAFPLVLGLILAFPYARGRTYLSTLLPAIAIAAIVPMAWLANGQLPGKVGWLLYLMGLFWSLGFLLIAEASVREKLYHHGIHSLSLLASDLLPLWIGVLLAAALSAAAMAGRLAEFGPLFELGWLGAAVAAAYQLIVLARARSDAFARAYHANLWFAFSLWIGTVSHYLCALKDAT